MAHLTFFRNLIIIVVLVLISRFVQASGGLEEVIVISEQVFRDTAVVSPTSKITIEQLQAVNMTTVEDALAYEPSLIVRKRFIGDPNGVIGMRGSNMFQTTRSMVFVDGMPLHYHLQTRYRGAPRWSLVSAGELEVAEVIYGPYSSEYSGNAMGGVVNIKTRRPDTERLLFEAGYFSQEYDRLNTDDTYVGYRAFAAYENKIDDLGVFFSYTNLQNESHPQTQLFTPPGSGTADMAAVSGAVQGVNEVGEAGIYFGDSGPEDTRTDLFKTKLFYDLGKIQLRASVAYEERGRVEDQHNSFLVDANGDPTFGRRVSVNGSNNVYDTYQFGRSRLQHRTLDRESLLIGLGASLELSSDWVGDAFYSYFEILQDVEIRSGNHPASPDYVADNEAFRARITEYDDTGWQIFDLKFAKEGFGAQAQQRLSWGLHYDAYELNYIVDDYNAIAAMRDADELDGDVSTGRSDSGGRANTMAIFTQYGHQLSEQWDMALGLRYETWEVRDGFIGDVQTGARSEDGISPKLSFAWVMTDDKEMRYSVARALRFPVIEELYVNDNQGAGAAAISDPTLKPEDGIFHNLSFSQIIESGSVRFNVFYEVIDDVIFNQQASNGVSTFLPVGEVTTQGVEFIWEQKNLFGSALDLRFNATYTDAEITENVFNPNFEGKAFPRSPKWRSNAILTYHLNDMLDVGGSLRYASDSFGALDNSDTVDNVFGAHDDYAFVGLKMNWQVTSKVKLSAGVDNVFNDEAYVYHPWPGRTFHLQAKYQIGE